MSKFASILMLLLSFETDQNLMDHRPSIFTFLALADTIGVGPSLDTDALVDVGHSGRWVQSGLLQRHSWSLQSTDISLV